MRDEIYCPICGSTDVLCDGENDFGGTDYYCKECGHDFTTEDQFGIEIAIKQTETNNNKQIKQKTL